MHGTTIKIIIKKNFKLELHTTTMSMLFKITGAETEEPVAKYIDQ
jgi:hypothetical protein